MNFRNFGGIYVSQSQFNITVEDGTMIEVKIDKANNETIGIVHLFHGMAEHMDRYDELVKALNLQGYDVIRHNHRGHGKNIDEKKEVILMICLKSLPMHTK